jgi:hypothetical protein
MPSACYIGDSYPYAQKHDPFIYYNDIRTNPSRCQSHVVPYGQLATDLQSASTTPSYAFITPNMCDDMHDCSVGTGDSWLQQQVPSILGSAAFRTTPSLLAIVWDEDDSTASNQVPAVFLGSGVIPGGRTATAYDHYSLLSSVESALSLPALTSNDANAAPVSDIFAAPPPTGWSNLGGAVTSDPAAASAASGQVDAFARGTDGALWHRAWQGSTWGAWESLGGGIVSNPTAVSQGMNRTDVFVRGLDNALWHRWWDGTSWHSWESIGGALTTGPAAASANAGGLDIFVRGTDGALWHRAWNGTSWLPWESLGGVLTSDPASASTGGGQIEVAARGADGAVWHRDFNGTAWSGWQSAGGQVGAPVAVASCANGAYTIFALGLDHAVWRRTFDGSGWGAWSDAGGYWTSGPAATCEPGTATIDLFERWTDYSLWRVQTT